MIILVAIHHIKFSVKNKIKPLAIAIFWTFSTLPF